MQLHLGSGCCLFLFELFFNKRILVCLFLIEAILLLFEISLDLATSLSQAVLESELLLLSLALEVIKCFANVWLGAFQELLKVLVRVDGLRGPFLHDLLPEAQHFGLLVLFQIGD